MITLNEEQVKKIEALLAEMPGKFCIPLLNILNEASSNNTTAPDGMQSDEEVHATN
jgi:hypothetical protein